MERKKFKDLAIGEAARLPLLLLDAKQEQSRNGAYCTLTMTDGEETAQAKMWQTTLDMVQMYLKSIVLVDLKVQEYNGRSYVASRMCAAGDSYPLADFIRMPPESPEEYYTDILSRCEHFCRDNSVLLRIVRHLYETNRERLLKASAAKRMHHNLRGGLMQHTATIVRHAESAALLYKDLDPELLLCAAALHDIGKLEELDTDELGVANYTVRGALLGHAAIGISMIEKAMADLGIEETEKTMLLKHCIAAHHGKQEWGAFVTPMTAEAEMLFLCDLTDARMYEYAAAAGDAGTVTDVFGIGKVYHPVR